MGIEEKLPSGVLLTSVEKIAGWARARSVWPATFGLACCAIELMQTGGPRHDLARFGMEKTGSTPREADLMIVAGRVSQKMAPVLRQIYDQMPEPKWVIAMGVCASSGGMFNNYAIVKLHMKIQNGDISGKVEVSQRGDENAPYLKPIDRDTQASKGLPPLQL